MQMLHSINAPKPGLPELFEARTIFECPGCSLATVLVAKTVYTCMYTHTYVVSNGVQTDVPEVQGRLKHNQRYR